MKKKKTAGKPNGDPMSVQVKFPNIDLTYPEFDVMSKKKDYKTKPNGKAATGRPDKYKPEYATQVEKLCLLGAIDEEIADFFQIKTSTLNRWKKKYEDFWEAIKRGKMAADANVATRLYQRALGYEHPDTDIRVVDGHIVKTAIRKYYPPDTAAAIFLLCNRQRGKWKRNVDFTTNGKDLLGTPETQKTEITLPDGTKIDLG